MVSRIKLAIVGMLLLVAGGFVVGYATGAESFFAHLVRSVVSAVRSIPFVGGALASGLGNYAQAEGDAGYGNYYDAGLVMLVLGLIAVGLGMRTPKVSNRAAGQVSTLASMTTKTKAAASQEVSQLCQHCGAKLGAAVSFCPACGRSTT